MTAEATRHAWIAAGFGMAWLAAGCGLLPSLPDGGAAGPAEYLGTAVCSTCHASVRTSHQNHGHAQAIKPVEGGAPVYPTNDTNAGVPLPPAGFDWAGISYVIGGYIKGANFADLGGFVLTDGTAGTQTQYNLAVPSLGLASQFAPFKPEQAAPLGYSYECFQCHTTGPASTASNGGLRQDNRPGIGGTWIEDGVGCEACHGPGSLHVPNPAAGRIEVTGAADACARCHVNADEPSLLGAADELVIGNQQWTELAAGPHAGLACTVCHDPHASIIREPGAGIRNTCQACHAQNMALHEGKVFRWGEFTESVTCTSCHMAPLARNASSATIQVRNGPLRLGDTRTHLVTIRTGASGAAEMFSADGSQVARDAAGRAFVTSCQVCQRCHNDLGNAFAFPPGEECSLGQGIHDLR